MQKVVTGGVTTTYSYNHNGLRTKKVVGSTTTEFVWHGDQLMHIHGATPMHFFYDGAGRVSHVSANGVMYGYLYNLQGDVIGLIDTSGALVVEYKYDAWGKLLGTSGSLAGSLGAANPFRYRGYQYDNETGLYYLKSRYYNPDWGRFISADVVLGKTGELLSHNLYCYCYNCPILLFDENGFASKYGELQQGWKYRIDDVNEDTEHIHIWRDGESWAQRKDGGPHDQGKNSPGGPSKKVMKYLKEKTGWDWDKKHKSYYNKIGAEQRYHVEYLTREDGTMFQRREYEDDTIVDVEIHADIPFISFPLFEIDLGSVLLGWFTGGLVPVF